MQKETLQNLKEKKKKILNSIKPDPLSCPLIPVIFIKKDTLGLIFKKRKLLFPKSPLAAATGRKKRQEKKITCNL